MIAGSLVKPALSLMNTFRNGKKSVIRAMSKRPPEGPVLIETGERPVFSPLNRNIVEFFASHRRVHPNSQQKWPILTIVCYLCKQVRLHVKNNLNWYDPLATAPWQLFLCFFSIQYSRAEYTYGEAPIESDQSPIGLRLAGLPVFFFLFDVIIRVQ